MSYGKHGCLSCLDVREGSKIHYDGVAFGYHYLLLAAETIVTINSCQPEASNLQPHQFPLDGSETAYRVRQSTEICITIFHSIPKRLFTVSLSPSSRRPTNKMRLFSYGDYHQSA